MKGGWIFLEVRLLFLAVIFCLTLGCSNNGMIDEPNMEVKRVGENITEPPSLTIAIGEQTIRTVTGSYSWSYYSEATEETIATEQDTAPPPELVGDGEVTMVHSDAEVELLFDYPPNDYTVNIWDQEQVIDSFDKVELTEYGGDVIYEIQANWEQGTVSYAFVLLIE